MTAPILSGMTTQIDDTLSAAALNQTERRAVARIVARLESELGDHLLAVWLYGSRARGEADPDETHYDRRSDIDMIAIVASGRDAAEASWELRPRWEAAVVAEGDSPPYYSLRFYDADFLRDRHALAAGDLDLAVSAASRRRPGRPTPASTTSMSCASSGSARSLR